MNRFGLGYRPHYYCSLVPSLFFSRANVHDRLEDPPEFVPQTSIERVIDTFSEKHPGEPSEAFVSLLQLGTGSFLMGVVVGGIKSGQHSAEKFMIAHQHAKFITPYEAKRKLQDTVFLDFFRGGIKWGFKAALFTVVYSFCVIVIPVLRGEQGIIEFSIGGAVAGALTRAYLGVKATLAGAFIGSLMSTAVGVIVFLSTTFAGVSMSNVRKMQYGWYEARRDAVLKARALVEKKKVDDTYSSLVDSHDLRLEKLDTDGYLENDRVYFVIPSDRNNETSSASFENIDKKEEIQKNSTGNDSVCAIVTETKSSSS